MWVVALFLTLTFMAWYAMPVRSRSRSGRYWPLIVAAAYVYTILFFWR